MLLGAVICAGRRSRANLFRADLSDARLQRAILDHAKLGGAKLKDAKLHVASLVGAELADYDTLYEDLDFTDGRTSPDAVRPCCAPPESIGALPSRGTLFAET
ncbi:pentapeptide repeat-containing protein [Nocardia sp. XZ_19_385]|uniref:pentapeptide repeat-containing protein n=1 Tax=Nocardia sp. XZ_19_385 TaxID=2769488 RepID=UPI00188FDA27